METKICTKCGRELPLSAFYKAKNRKNEFYPRCKECRKQDSRQYRLEHKEQRKEYLKRYFKTPMGRAYSLLGAYNQSDKQHNRGNGDLTAKWIVENIFTKSCKCGESDWRKLGCNRLDNNKPHTKDNVEPCCMKCNKKLPRKYV